MYATTKTDDQADNSDKNLSACSGPSSRPSSASSSGEASSTLLGVLALGFFLGEPLALALALVGLLFMGAMG